MKNISYKVLLIAIFVGAFTACEDFLDENPTGALTTNSSVSSVEVARAFANSAYASLTVLNNSGGGWGGNNASLMEFMTGKAEGNSQTEAFKFNQLEYDARGFYLDNWWSGMYGGISRCNLALTKLSEFTTLTDVDKANLIAEVRTMRALYYFYLVRMFGDVPKITTNPESLDEVQAPRSPLKEIYDEIIIPDLLEAEKSSLPWKDATGKISMGAIKSILADVYLTYAGYPVQGGTQFYAESAVRSKDVIENGGYTLFPEYTDMINTANRNTGEFILQVQHAKTIRENNLTPVTLPPFRGIAAYTDEYGGLIPRREFVESFEPGDKRTEEKQYFYTYYKGHPNDYPVGDARRDSLNLGGYFTYKYFDKQAIDTDSRSELNFTVYRLADVMLMYAEASNRAEGGPNVLASQSLNAIRDRAKLLPVTTTDMEEFEKAVWAERYYELNFENKMWFDMIRTRQVRNDLTTQWEPFVGHTNLFGKTFTENQLLLPIPQREVDNNRNLEQNPGF